MAVSNTKVFKGILEKKEHLNKLNFERKRLIFERNYKKICIFLNISEILNVILKLYTRS